MNPFQDLLPVYSSRPGTARADRKANNDTTEPQPRPAHEFQDIELRDFAPGNHNRNNHRQILAPAPAPTPSISGRTVNTANSHANAPVPSHDLEAGRPRRRRRRRWGATDDNDATPATCASHCAASVFMVVLLALCILCFIGLAVAIRGGPFQRPEGTGGL
ncbi:hypothetical protein NKR19_g7153 [Coniochaeta hoffmannii]|uniref:Uncharacterized protein n=1 Tax=Coniochaeta hoffmannii TaxID=91930 RepID=A0AA38R937_9PEZI|nr:hypothetical protein NKR19_g7153 [Coniochaeta hoffmannii]